MKHPAPKVDLSKRNLGGKLDAALLDAQNKPTAKSLLLSDNALSSLCAIAPHFASLAVLLVDHNQLTALGDEVCALQMLIKLHLESNRITRLSPKITQLKLLKKLYLSDNALQELPAEVGQLIQLQLLDVRRNRLASLPPSLAQCGDLEDLRLDGNPFPLPFLYTHKPVDVVRLYLAERASATMPATATAVTSAPGAAPVTLPLPQFIFHRRLGGVGESDGSKSARGSKPGGRTASGRSTLYNDAKISLEHNYALYFLSDAAETSLQGKREYQEDRVRLLPRLAEPTPSDALTELENIFSKVGMFCVFDGHGGFCCSEYLARHLPSAIVNQSAFRRGDFAGAVLNAFTATDGAIIKYCFENKSTDGSTACVVLTIDNVLLCAHVGDTRAVLCRKKKALRLTEDHKPSRPDEETRIKAAGGTVAFTGGAWRVNGHLGVSRSFGDLQLKDNLVVTSEPELSRIELTPDDELFIVATDGLWDFVSDQKAVDVARKCTSAAEASTKLAELALKRGSEDNVTVAVVRLRWQLDELGSSSGGGGGGGGTGGVMPSIQERLGALSDKTSMREALSTTSGGDDGGGGKKASVADRAAQAKSTQLVGVVVAPSTVPTMVSVTPDTTVLALLRMLEDVDEQQHELYHMQQPQTPLSRTATVASLLLANRHYLIARTASQPTPTITAAATADDDDAAYAAASPASLSQIKQRHNSLLADSAATVAPPLPKADAKPRYGGLPEGWAELECDDGRLFYFNVTTKQTAWQRPSDVDAPPPWLTATSLLGKTYYHNAVTGERCWTLPDQDANK